MENLLNKYQPLYLKYRPQSLSDLVGQTAVAKTLANAIEHKRLSHAYLFTGPRGTGKTSTARILAKSVNCQAGPSANPCQTCTACAEITAGISPSVFEIDAASNNSVDDARILIERAPLVAVSGRFKLYIIDECHMLTKEAFNALLKTIEEPPANVIFVLATTEEHKVPATIVSRCQRLIFKLAGQSDLTKHLQAIAQKEKIAIESDAIDLISRRAAGGLRDALGLLDQASLLSLSGNPVSVSNLLEILGAVAEDTLLEISQYIYERQGQGVLVCVNKLLLEGREPANIVLELAKHFLNLTKACYLLNTNSSEKQSELIFGSQKYITALCKQAELFDKAELSCIVNELDKLELTCRRSSQPAMNLEAGLLSICHRHDISLVSKLEERIQNLENNTQPTNKTIETKKVEIDKVQVKSPAPATSIKEVQIKKESEPSEPETKVSPKQTESNNIDLDLEKFWEQLLDAVQKTSIPAYSVLVEHAFPLSLTSSEFIIGVINDQFKTHVERRLDRIKGTCETVLGHGVNIKVKIDGNKPVKKNDLVSNQDENIKVDHKPEPELANNAPKVIAGKMASTVLSHESNSNSNLHETYKLFEGPGSRLIV